MKRPNGYALIILIFSTILTCSCNGKIDMNEKLSNNRHTENERITFKEGKKIKELLFNFNKLKLPNEDRRFVQIELNSKFKLGGVNNELLLTPSFVKVDKNKNIYVLDNIDSSVKKFDNMGHYVEKYGKKGAGPGEFERAWNFDVSVDGVTVISSPNNNKFAVFDRDEIIEFKPIDMAINLCFTTTGEVLIFQIADLINKSPFRRIDYKKDIIIEYQNILKTKKNEGMLPFLMGDVHRYRDNNIVYISQIMGYIVIYDDDGKIVSVFRLIDKVVHSGLTKREEKIAGFSSPLVRF
ncbi:MAG: 6-bladed beta-propeller, partial [Ignavibacteriae bacterium]|nr:6-bladed beta-propeller [Ignavibacteriota bacterium]